MSETIAIGIIHMSNERINIKLCIESWLFDGYEIIPA